ncbi:hypothetical protein OS493_034807, partial [Desmophyllum pertusum]
MNTDDIPSRLTWICVAGDHGHCLPTGTCILDGPGTSLKKPGTFWTGSSHTR